MHLDLSAQFQKTESDVDLLRHNKGSIYVLKDKTFFSRKPPYVEPVNSAIKFSSFSQRIK